MAYTGSFISNLYKKRDDITQLKAEAYFIDARIVGKIGTKNADPLKLCTYLLLEKLGTERAWQLVRNFVVLGDHTQQVYECMGKIFRKAYKDALTCEPDEGIVTRIDVAEHLYRPLMEHCIQVKRIHAKKFRWILLKATFERDEHLARMLYTISTPIVWRYLTSVNPDIRLGAYFVQVNVFPPSGDDEITMTDYFNRHCEAFLAALDDNSVEICVQAIGGVCEVASTFYENIPDAFMDKILNKLAGLANDNLAEIRAAVYHGLRHFHGCAKGILKFEKLLRSICPNAIDDPSDRVRCNVFRLLNKMTASRLKIIMPPKTTDPDLILDLTEVLYRLDYEESEAIEREICQLIYTVFFHKNLPSEDRYKILNNMCRINRSASLDFHRLLYTINRDDVAGVLAHMSSILNVCSRVLKKVVAMYEEQEEEMLTDNDTQNQSRPNIEVLNKRLLSCMNVIDCMVICFSSMRYDPSFDSSTVQSQGVARYFSEIASEIILHFENKPELLDTALSIISLIRNAGMQASKLKNDCARMLRVGYLNKRYLEIYGLVDMGELLELIKKGFHQLENSLFAVENTPAPRRKGQQSDELKTKTVMVEALMTLLNLPTCSQYIVEKYMHYVHGFIDQLDRICGNFLSSLRNKKKIDMELFKTCWKIWSVLMIIKYNESVYTGSKDDKDKKRPLGATVINHRRRSTVIKMELEEEANLDPMIKECRWMQMQIKDCPELSANSEVIEHFYDMISLHFQSYTHNKTPVRIVLKYIKELQEMEAAYPRSRPTTLSYLNCVKNGEHALEYGHQEPTVTLEPIENGERGVQNA